MLRYCLVLLLGFYVNAVFAQSKWQSKGTLYHDKSIAVRLEYKLNTGNSHKQHVKVSQYRYRITRHKGKKSFYITWRLDYFNSTRQHLTQLNSLHITKATKTGVLVPKHHTFKASKAINYFADAKPSHSAPAFGDYKLILPPTANSLKINGRLNINLGESTTLTIDNPGRIASDSLKWYENECGKNLIGTGTSISVHPLKSTTYFVKVAGAKITNCTSIAVTVTGSGTNSQANVTNAISYADDFIVGRSEICQGEKKIKLTVAGKPLPHDSRWIWYQDNGNGVPFNVGYTVLVSPKFNTTYLVRAEGPAGKGVFHSHQIIVAVQSAMPQAIAGPDFVPYKQKLVLGLHGGNLGNGAKWIWYTGTVDNKKRIGEGKTITVDSVTATQTYYVRAESACQSTDFVAKTIKVSGAPMANSVKPTAFFVNVGTVASYLNYLGVNSNYIVTVGRGGNVGWYVRGKFSVKPTSETYQTDLTYITNYNAPGYYQYTGRTINQHMALTGGFYFGRKYVSIYAGGGYGDRKLLRQINQYNYDGSGTQTSSWVKDVSLSRKGIEGEAGLLIDIGRINIMSGISTIEFKYIEYNLGVGYSFR